MQDNATFKMILFDLDEVLTDTTSHWFKHYNQNAEKHDHIFHDINRNDVTYWEFPIDFCAQCYAECLLGTELLKTQKLRFGVKTTLRTMSNNFRLGLLTHRPQYVEDATRQWLEDVGIAEYFSVILITGEPKRRVAESIGATWLIDDNPQTIQSLVGSSVTPIVFDSPWNRTIDNVDRIKSIRDILKLESVFGQSSYVC